MLNYIQVEEAPFSASHVEIAFRDAYLTRADMWRLVISELAGKSMYRGQKLLFMNTIKAHVKTMYYQGRKIQSAFFGTGTKAIFRSESARYVLFIQMSREMWDFDVEETGEIMFHKVINGFLPELFKRWQDIGARHLVSIILFTRMEYERPLSSTFEHPKEDPSDPSITNDAGKQPYKDFYRVLVSDMASGEWSAILTQLKREFKVFLRDVSIRTVSPLETFSLGREGLFGSGDTPREIIAGRPTAASQGNILEAINVASSQFSGDYIDRDLVRTGLSIIVVSPGAGIFEVDHRLLNLTTDVLVENGVGIDLVCLSRMPLHSVPLFKYKRPTSDHKHGDMDPKNRFLDLNAKISSSFGSTQSYRSTSEISSSNSADDLYDLYRRNRASNGDPWFYGIPHWVDVSFWAPMPNGDAIGEDGAIIRKVPRVGPKPFVPRIRMYEVQMMGIMENEMSNISIPYLRDLPAFSRRLDIRSPHKLHPSASLVSLNALRTKSGTLNSVSSQMSGSPRSPSASPNTLDDGMKAYSSIVQWMDKYDESVFHRLARPIRSSRLKRVSLKEDIPENDGLEIRQEGPKVSKVMSEKSPDESTMLAAEQHSIHKISTDTRGRKSSNASSTSKPPAVQSKQAKLTRHISFGFRGFGGAAPKATPVTELSSENAHPESLLGRGLKPSISSNKPQSTKAPSERDVDISLSKSPMLQPTEKLLQTPSPGSEQISKPIAIKSMPRKIGKPQDALAQERDDYEKLLLLQEKIRNDGDVEVAKVLPMGLSPRKAMAPWLTVLNPSNPQKAFADRSRTLGRWHHVFPRPLHASHIKWKSLCSPASVPLTTEVFPTLDHLKSEYDEDEYRVTCVRNPELSEEPKSNNWLLREMMSARFSHGFQVVVGPLIASTLGMPSLQSLTIFDDEVLGQKGNKVYMSRGSKIHCLHSTDEGVVEVKQYTRRQAAAFSASDNSPSSYIYKPVVRTTLSDKYYPREVMLSVARETYDWYRLDTFISGHEEQQAGSYPDLLRFWRARYVLLPAGLPANARRRMTNSGEDNEEEVRLEGIRKLTQLWQRNRYVPPDERRFQSTTRKRKDDNPLDIIYETRTPSAVVAGQLSDTLLQENDANDGAPSQLLPESELFERSNLNLNTLAQAIQGEGGVKMMNRRWHLKLHYSCFIGQEFTSWLIDNFRDVDTRGEAEEFGNELMKGGLFVHVEKRHNFRDGNFFYQIASEFRAPRSEFRNSWFGMVSSDRSVPPTPISENSKSRGLRSRSSTDDEKDDNSDGGTSTPTKKNKIGVALSKKLIYDVDSRRRSYRPELITLHYDRISSADDCYHLRIDWMNVTPKLIEDAIANWASTAERFGMRLVELPIREASKINEVHPFRGPYVIKLAKDPPEQGPKEFVDATSLTPRAATNHPYHKAILKKFRFVLDLEAAKDFPPLVDVTYSWGQPDYQYTQFISREGILLAQITEKGEILLLANRLYNNRTAAARGADRAQKATAPDLAANGPQHRSPARGPGVPRKASPRGSPFNSPLIRATADVGLQFARLPDAITPERMKNDLEAFCHDVEALEKFYEDTLHGRNSSSAIPSTPLVGSSTVPSLGAPPVLSLREGSPFPLAMKLRTPNTEQ